MIHGNTSHKSLVVDILTSAFKDITVDNSINYIVGHDDRRMIRLRLLMEYLFDRAIKFGDVFITDNKTGCLLVVYSERERMDLVTVLADIRLGLQCIGVTRIVAVLRRQRIVSAAYPDEPHVRPIIMGVRPEIIGRGSTIRMIYKLYEQFMSDTRPIIIDTVTEANVKLYKKLGFKEWSHHDQLGYRMYLLRKN